MDKKIKQEIDQLENMLSGCNPNTPKSKHAMIKKTVMKERIDQLKKKMNTAIPTPMTLEQQKNIKKKKLETVLTAVTIIEKNIKKKIQQLIDQDDPTKTKREIEVCRIDLKKIIAKKELIKTSLSRF